MSITKRHMRELERLFDSEVCAALHGGSHLIRSRARIYTELEQEGLVAYATETIGHDRFGRISVSGYELTHAGRLLYCASCPP